jgi:hypothetical protein
MSVQQQSTQIEQFLAWQPNPGKRFSASSFRIKSASRFLVSV